MIRYIPIKRAVKMAAGWGAVLLQPLSCGFAAQRACILTYHRVAQIDFVDPSVDDHNVLPAVLARQLAGLAQFADVIALQELPARLSESARESTQHQKPLVVLTFDDGYANFCSEALPLLQRYHLPATVFVVTSLVEHGAVLPFDGWSSRNRDRVAPDVIRSMNWAEIETCLRTGLVTVGSHSHRHLKGTTCSGTQFEEEVQQSRDILHHRLGDSQGNAYAYPYGSTTLGFVPHAYRHAVMEAGYELAVSSDLGRADAGSDRHRLPRIEAYGLDTPAVLRAKAGGSLLPFYCVDRLRRQRRSDEYSR